MDFLNNLLGQLFKFVYETVESLGLGSAHISNYAYALIVMGLFYKVITIPMTIQSARNAEKQRKMQPELDKIKQKYGYDQQIYQKKMMEFQKENNMMQGCGGSCLTFIIQMVIIFALYKVIQNPKTYIHNYDKISRVFFWIPDLALADPTGYLLPLINSVSQLGFQYFNRNNMGAGNAQMNSMQTMMYIMPVMFFFIFRTLPAGLVLYWTVGNFIEIIIRGAGLLIGKIKARG